MEEFPVCVAFGYSIILDEDHVKSLCGEGASSDFLSNMFLVLRIDLKHGGDGFWWESKCLILLMEEK